MDQTILAKAALAFLGRDAKANGFDEARTLLRVAEWLTSLTDVKSNPPKPAEETAPEDWPATKSNEQWRQALRAGEPAGD